MKVKVDINTEASGFGYAAVGQYTLRVASVEFKAAKSEDKFPGILWQFEFVNPNIESSALRKDGTPKPLGKVMEFTTLKSGNNAQFKLRQLCEAVDEAWVPELELDDFIGLEFEAVLDIDSYQDEMRNKVNKFLPAA